MSDIYTTGSNNVNSAYKTGADAINAFDPTSWTNSTNTGLSNIKSGQDATQNAYTQSYKNAIAANPTMTDAYNTANEKYNVQGLQNTSNQLNNAVLTTPQNNYDRTKGFNVDNGQVQAQTTQDLARLSPLAIAAQNNATTAQNNAQGYVTQQQSQNATNLLPIQEQGQYLADSYARQQTGFLTTQQNQLQALQDKMNQGVSLSSTEMQQYAQLAQMEAQYQAQLNTNSTAVKTAQIGQQYQPVNAGQTLINTANGSTYRAS